jgi:hypothetical protein
MKEAILHTVAHISMKETTHIMNIFPGRFASSCGTKITAAQSTDGCNLLAKNQAVVFLRREQRRCPGYGRAVSSRITSRIKDTMHV